MVGDVGNVLFGEATGGRFEGLKGIAEHVVEKKGDAAELELGEVPVERLPCVAECGAGECRCEFIVLRLSKDDEPLVVSGDGD